MDVVGQIVERTLAGEDGPAFLALPAGVAVRDEGVELAVLDDLLGDQQAAGAGVHRADMGDQQIVGIERLAADLGVEVEAALAEAAGLEDVVGGERHLRHVHGELVGVPAELVVAAVDVDGAEDAERAGERQLVLEGVAGEDGVVLLDVDLDLFLEAELLQHAPDRADVEIVLVLGRLLRLGLDEDGALEADLVLVLDDHGQEAAELVELLLDVGVEQGLVALAAAPQHVVGAAELMGQLEHVLHLRRGIGEHVRVGIGRRARHVAAVGEQVGGAPQQPDLGLLHLLGEDLADVAHVPVGFGQRLAFRRDVAVVEGEEGHAEQAEHLEGDVGLQLAPPPSRPTCASTDA